MQRYVSTEASDKILQVETKTVRNCLRKEKTTPPKVHLVLQILVKLQKAKKFLQKKNYSNWLVTKVTTSPDMLLTNITRGGYKMFGITSNTY